MKKVVLHVEGGDSLVVRLFLLILFSLDLHKVDNLLNFIFLFKRKLRSRITPLRITTWID